MKLVYTEQAFLSLKEVLAFITPHVSQGKVAKIRDRIFDKIRSPLARNLFLTTTTTRPTLQRGKPIGMDQYRQAKGQSTLRPEFDISPLPLS
jgi:hypothetical protein